MDKGERIIAAVRNKEEFDTALKSGVSIIFFLCPDIIELESISKMAHDADKKLFIHVDLTSGLGKDKSGMAFVKRAGADGVISTRTSLIKAAHDIGLITVQRFFAVDSQAVETTAESLKNSKADMIEIMPGVIPKIIERLKKRISVPIIAGGFIETDDEIKSAVSHGAYAISTGKRDLWR